MDTSELDRMLRATAPQRISDDQDARVVSIDLVASTRVEAAEWGRNRRRRRLVIGIPVAALGAIALTAGGVVAHDLLPQITTIPISYTTDTGKTISCHASIDGGGDTAETTRAIAEYVNSTSWSGIGQKIYDYAIAHPWQPNPKDSWQDTEGKTHEGDPPMTAAERDNQSWDDAMSVYIPGPLPKSITAGSGSGSTLVSWGWGSQDCHGVLH